MPRCRRWRGVRSQAPPGCCGCGYSARWQSSSGLAALEAGAHGATWVARVRVSDALVYATTRARRDGRRRVRGSALTRAMPVAAAPLPIAEQVLAFRQRIAPISSSLSARASATTSSEPGRHLWTIAAHFYGSGDEYRRLVEANVGRRMSNGAAFTPQGIIQPGWVLEVPGPTVFIEQEGIARWYTVRPATHCRPLQAHPRRARPMGGSIRVRIATRHDCRMARALDDPDLIWPRVAVAPCPTRRHLPVPNQPSRMSTTSRWCSLPPPWRHGAGAVAYLRPVAPQAAEPA